MNTTERCRKNQTAILKAIADTGQARIAEKMGVSESTISRYKDAEIERLAAVLAAAGLKVVPESTPTVDPERLNAITMLARDSLNQIIESGWGSLG